ncbi:hypothetical protein QW71_03790 [Paenibacillus sp. IHB B 3415]|uniref:hypothetical protein n=1 Tax=Paenibacillus sp. IHB B 3415 TaxID=867080 RepID=UPI000573DD49|nr:hypothetical protein [Paenibacillus sp. IHB B 3415]KHL97042.1 hypothetical protein QW71_03790 [Paenibacillus sp. IHB B 3415]
MILTKKEAVVIEMIRKRLTRKDIARKLVISIYEVDNIVSRLVERSAIQRSEFGRGECKVLLDAYEINDNSEQLFKSKKGIEVLIPEKYEEYIRNQYGVIPRREIAKQLNLNKVTLNQMIMQLGLGGKEMVQINK